MFKTKDIISKITMLIGLLVLVYSAIVFSSYDEKFQSSEVVEGNVIDYRKNKDGINVPVVMDSVGKDTFDMSINSLKPRGMLVSFGNASGAVPAFAPLLLAQKGSLFITRPTLSHYVADPDEQQELADALFKRVLNGEIKINVNHEFALHDAKSAHDALESGTTTGSVVLIP